MLWLAQNPDLAHSTGRITDAQWENLMNGMSMNDGLDENGNRIVDDTPASSGGGGSSPSWAQGGWDPGNHTEYSKNLQALIATNRANGKYTYG